jgi:hypothetical protein
VYHPEDSSFSLYRIKLQSHTAIQPNVFILYTPSTKNRSVVGHWLQRSQQHPAGSFDIGDPLTSSFPSASAHLAIHHFPPFLSTHQQKTDLHLISAGRWEQGNHKVTENRSFILFIYQCGLLFIELVYIY